MRILTRDQTKIRAYLLENGAGISVMDEMSSQAALQSGKLVRVLSDWTLPKGDIYAVYPPGRHIPVKVRVFVAFYLEFIRLP